MKTETIIKNNKLIAEFMGYNVYHTPSGTMFIGHRDDFHHENFGCTKTELNKMFKDGHLQAWYTHQGSIKFDSSWDWLMDVVSKIETINLGAPSLMCVRVCIKGNSCRIFKGGWSDDKEGFISFVSYETNKKQYAKIEATYLAVVEFIKWYNNQKKEIKSKL